MSLRRLLGARKGNAGIGENADKEEIFGDHVADLRIAGFPIHNQRQKPAAGAEKESAEQDAIIGLDLENLASKYNGKNGNAQDKRLEKPEVTEQRIQSLLIQPIQLDLVALGQFIARIHIPEESVCDQQENEAVKTEQSEKFQNPFHGCHHATPQYSLSRR
jgi:hypothetical protein